MEIHHFGQEIGVQMISLKIFTIPISLRIKAPDWLFMILIEKGNLINPIQLVVFWIFLEKKGVGKGLYRYDFTPGG